MPPSIEISTDPTRLDVDLIHRFLSTSYWAQGRTRETVERSIRHSICCGAYDAGRQVAFGRVITDCAVFAYLADIFVIPEYRGRGISKILVRAMLDHPDVSSVRVVMLRTRDAQSLYRQFGFKEILELEEVMALHRSGF
jgi:ribosomal protein S18 acetylase RimI-like enzyme